MSESHKLLLFSDQINLLISKLLTDIRWVQGLGSLNDYLNRKRIADILLHIGDVNDHSQVLLSAILFAEIERSENPNVILRENTTASYVLCEFLRREGEEYLKWLMTPLVEDMLSNDYNFTLNRHKITSNSEKEYRIVVDARVRQFEKIVNTFLGRLISSESISRMPISIRVLAGVCLLSCENFDIKDPSRMIGGLLFLRFINPMIAAPMLLFPERIREFTKPIKNNFVLISKVLQKTSNHSRFGMKEPDLAPLNGFIDYALPQIDDWLLTLCIDISATPCDSIVAFPAQEYDERRLLDMWNYFIDKRADISIYVDTHSSVSHGFSHSIVSLGGTFESIDFYKRLGAPPDNDLHVDFQRKKAKKSISNTLTQELQDTADVDVENVQINGMIANALDQSKFFYCTESRDRQGNLIFFFIGTRFFDIVSSYSIEDIALYIHKVLTTKGVETVNWALFADLCFAESLLNITSESSIALLQTLAFCIKNFHKSIEVHLQCIFLLAPYYTSAVLNVLKPMMRRSLYKSVRIFKEWRQALSYVTDSGLDIPIETKQSDHKERGVSVSISRGELKSRKFLIRFVTDALVFFSQNRFEFTLSLSGIQQIILDNSFPKRLILQLNADTELDVEDLMLPNESNIEIVLDSFLDRTKFIETILDASRRNFVAEVELFEEVSIRKGMRQMSHMIVTLNSVLFVKKKRVLDEIPFVAIMNIDCDDRMITIRKKSGDPVVMYNDNAVHVVQYIIRSMEYVRDCEKNQQFEDVSELLEQFNTQNSEERFEEVVNPLRSPLVKHKIKSRSMFSVPSMEIELEVEKSARDSVRYNVSDSQLKFLVARPGNTNSPFNQDLLMVADFDSGMDSMSENSQNSQSQTIPLEFIES
ncbi:hypothetical protein PCE1_004237 [Barthelona sp. PCE]